MEEGDMKKAGSSSPGERPASQSHTGNRHAADEPSQGDHSVVVLDDDPSILKGLELLLTSRSYKVRLHQSPEELLDAGQPSAPACLLLDNHLGDCMSGLEVYQELQRLGWWIPIVFITAHWSVNSVVKAMRAGADGYLTKPYDPAELLDVVSEALSRSAELAKTSARAAEARALAATLTDRERQIVDLIVKGHLNKEIADRLGLALVTVKVHRGRAMQKLKAGNPAELVHVSRLAGLIP